VRVAVCIVVCVAVCVASCVTVNGAECVAVRNAATDVDASEIVCDEYSKKHGDSLFQSNHGTVKSNSLYMAQSN